MTSRYLRKSKERSYSRRIGVLFQRLLALMIKLRYVFVVLFLVFSAVFIYFVVEVYKVDLSKLEEPIGAPTVIYDRNGNPVSELSSARFSHVTLSEIPEDLIHAIISVEDQRFFSHNGIDVRGIARSAWRNVRAGAVVEGGSTITQQLAKNLFLTSDRTFGRKFREALIALRIERELGKEEIMELYLNHIYFGEGTWGIENAAKVYFGKNVKDITLEEAGVLAALPKAPTHFSPFQNVDRALERRNLVLFMMLNQGYIDEGRYEEAVGTEIVLRDWEIEEDSLRGKYPSYVDFVIDEAITVHGLTEERIWAGDLHIYTEMDVAVQDAIQSAFANDALFPEAVGEEMVQAASVVLDPYTGGVRGLIGNRSDEHVYRGFNRAYQLKRQPGSSIKPLAVFAPALEGGYDASSVLVDERLDFAGYSPRNYDGQYRGRVSLYDAVVHSINVPAVWLLNEIGVDAGLDFLGKTGIALHEDDRSLSVALGGLTVGTSPLQMAQAFSVFPNLGERNEAFSITRITAGNGDVLAEGDVQGTQVMAPENAYRMTQLLEGVVVTGTGKNAMVGGRPTAGKTGTTQLPPTEAFQGVTGVSDSWFVGFTPELVTAVWVGYDRITPDYVMQSSGGNHPAKVFQAIMSEALEGVPVSAFVQPKGWKEDKKNANEGAGKKEKKNEEPGKGNGKKEEKGKGKDKDDNKGKGKGKNGKGNDKGKGKGKGKGNGR